MQFRHSTTIPESRRDISKVHTTPVFVSNHTIRFKKGMIEHVGRSDSDWAGDSSTRQRVTGDHCNIQGVVLCKRSRKHTAISLSCFLQNLSKNFTTQFQFVPNWTQILHVRYSREGDQEDSSTSKFVASPHKHGSKRSVYRLDAWIRQATQSRFSLHTIETGLGSRVT